MVDRVTTPDSTGHNHTTQRRRRKIILQIAMAVIIFVSGIVVGSGGTMSLLKRRVIWIHRHPKKSAAAIAKQICSKYGLNEEQTNKVESIFGKGIQERKAIRQEMGKKFEAERQALIAEMKKVLTPEQFKQWHQDFEARFEKFRKMRKSKVPEAK